jgi:hypothetical protein
MRSLVVRMMIIAHGASPRSDVQNAPHFTQAFRMAAMGRLDPEPGKRLPARSSQFEARCAGIGFASLSLPHTWAAMRHAPWLLTRIGSWNFTMASVRQLDRPLRVGRSRSGPTLAGHTRGTGIVLKLRFGARSRPTSAVRPTPRCRTWHHLGVRCCHDGCRRSRCASASTAPTASSPADAASPT